MDANGSNENTPSGFAPPQASDTSSSATGSVPALSPSTKDDLLDGPVVLAQPPVLGNSVPKARSGSTESRPAVEAPEPALELVKDAFTGAKSAVSSGYRTVSASTDEFAHDSPWKSIAFAVLGGIIIGMLVAR
ncbi:glycine zipper domain-containing protein [Paraburkholderia xenovorans]|uniref:glycine zipper domain-containing protein n=1 Tax=Paraburkholderia xenovorans TaxID=36873 RepID=UPI0038BC1B98